MTQNPILAMETRMAYQEKLLQELSDVVFNQQKEIDQLNALCKTLTRHIQALTENLDQSLPPNERPPHY